ncbi:hypothetical protein ACIP5Y_00880 [Nocardia sp. NPDC088792]|uniref:hypothetical protein n=1 Tax=Nocardia sp. NPDC088792 TaxID=3364332 RepID=UPI00380BFDC0
MPVEPDFELNSEILDAFANLVRKGLNLTDVAGSYDSDIDAMAASQDAPHVPTTVRDVLRLIGTRPGPYELVAGSLGVSAVGKAYKRLALELLNSLPPDAMKLTNPDQMFIVAVFESEMFTIIDGSELSHPNPPVWTLHGDYKLVKRWPSVTEWFSEVSRGVARNLHEH